MEKIASSVTELIGNTPLLELKVPQCSGRILAKLEMWNPAGSAKDRVALAILEDAEAKGILQPGGTIVEASSGNTGIALCAVAAARGYHCVITMPENMSRERWQLMQALGAKVILTPASKGMTGAVEEAQRIASTTENCFAASQFANPENPHAHYRTTGPEILRAAGKVDLFVAGIGTGGTISGVGRYLKEQDASTKVVGVEPAESAILSGAMPGSHGISGIGAGFVPDTLERKYVDHVLPVTTENAMAAARRIAREMGLLVGISAGAAFHAVVELMKGPGHEGQTAVVVFPDSGERYLSTDLFV